MNIKEIKQRYFDKVLANANEIECKCGCGTIIKDKDAYGRDKFYVNGHNTKKYDDPYEYKRQWNIRNKDKRLTAKYAYLNDRKAKLVLFKGGKCEICGIDFDGCNSAIFDFHHINPKEKAKNFRSLSVDEMYKEVDKCMLVCSNCHRLIHFETNNTASPAESL